MKLLSLILIYLIIIIVFPNRLISQVLIIKGQVIDSSTSLPIAYAMVEIGKDTNMQRQMTDEGGYFAFKKNSRSVFYKVSALSFDTLEGKFDSIIDNGKNINILVRLKQRAVNLSEVTIAKSRIIQKMDRTVYNFSEKEVKSAINAMQLLSMAPLININTEGGILIKGKEGTQIFIDGKQVLDNNMLKNLPPDLITKVEVITNPNSQYDAKSGVINVVTKSGWLGNYGRLSMQLGTYNTNNFFLYISSKSKKIDINLTTGVNSYNKPFSSEALRSEKDKELFQIIKGRNKSLQPSLSLATNFKIDSNRQFSIFNNIYIPLFWKKNENIYYKPAFSNSDLEIDFTQKNDIKDVNFSTKNYIDFSRRSWKSSLFISFLAYNYSYKNDNRLQIKNDQISFARQSNSSSLSEYSSQIDYSKTKSQKYEYSLGSKFISRSNSSKYNLLKYDSSKNSFFVDTSLGFNDRFESNQIIASIYFDNRIKLNNKLSASIGLRCEYSNENILELASENRIFFLPAITFQYSLNSNNNFKIDFRRKVYRPGITYLNPFINISDARSNQTGNKFLLPESNNIVELSYDRVVKSHLLSFSLLFNLNRNEINSFYQFKNLDNFLIKTVNLDKYTSLGFSSFYRLKVTENFSFSANFIIEKIELQLNELSKDRWYLSANANATYVLTKNITARCRINYASAPPLIQGLNSEVSGVELSIGKKIGSNWNLELNARNFLKVNSLRTSVISNDFYSQKEEKNFALNLYSFSIQHSFGKNNYNYRPDVKIKNNDLKN